MWLTRFRELSLALRVLFLASFVNRAGMFVFPLLAVYLVRAKGLSLAEVGLLISLGSTGLLVGSLLSGPFCDLCGRRQALLLALLLNAAGYLGLATLDVPPWAFVALLFVALVGMGMFGPASNTLIADLTTTGQRPFAYTVSYIGNNLGTGIGPLLGGVAAAYSYHVMFVGNIVAGLLCAALIAVWIPADSRRGAGRKGRKGSKKPREKVRYGTLGHGHVVALVLVSFFYIVPLNGLEYALPLAVTTVLGEPTGLIGVIYAINSVAVVSFGLLIEKRLPAYRTKVLLIVAGLLWALGLSVLTFALSLPVMLLSILVWTLGEVIVSVVVPTYIADHVDERRVGSFMALNGFVLALSRLVVPAGLGFIWQSHGVGRVFFTLLVTSMVGLAVFALLRIRTAGHAASGRPTASSAHTRASPVS
ncbi:MFS transporter [Streptomyces sp. NPDC048637]|uniref:MFS transporter n=1 Tax=Streptomyces sp. NPDC048637 TaxID=3155636 RepID=UPI00344ADC03